MIDWDLTIESPGDLAIQCPLLDGHRLELTLMGFGVKRAGNRFEFAQVNDENLHAILLLWEGGLRFLLLSHGLHRFFSSFLSLQRILFGGLLPLKF